MTLSRERQYFVKVLSELGPDKREYELDLLSSFLNLWN